MRQAPKETLVLGPLSSIVQRSWSAGIVCQLQMFHVETTLTTYTARRARRAKRVVPALWLCLVWRHRGTVPGPTCLAWAPMVCTHFCLLYRFCGELPQVGTCLPHQRASCLAPRRSILVQLTAGSPSALHLQALVSLPDQNSPGQQSQAPSIDCV